MRIRSETLKKAKGKKSTNMHAFVTHERGRGRHGGGGRGESGRGRGGRRSGREGRSDDAATGEGVNLVSVTCWRCQAKVHYTDKCTIKLCDRCGGRGHDSNKCSTPAEEHANLTMEVDDCSDSPSESTLLAEGF